MWSEAKLNTSFGLAQSHPVNQHRLFQTLELRLGGFQKSQRSVKYPNKLHDYTDFGLQAISRMTTIALLHLPVEVFCQVVEKLDDLDDVLALALTCRSASTICLQLTPLWFFEKLAWKRAYSFMSSWSDPNYARIMSRERFRFKALFGLAERRGGVIVYRPRSYYDDSKAIAFN